MTREDEVSKMIEDVYDETGLITETFNDKNLNVSDVGKGVLIKFEIGSSENLTNDKAILTAISYLRVKMKLPLAVIEFVAFGKDENKGKWQEYIQTIMHALSADDISYISPLVDERHQLLHRLAIGKNARLMKELYKGNRSAS